jgi:AcrR family transcriptional regulator
MPPRAPVSPPKRPAKRGAPRKKAAPPPPQLRGPRLVAKIIEATLEELSRVGYGALSMESVAALAAVNKTTLYRRWPTKSDLARAALHSIADENLRFEDHGSLREDLLGVLQKHLRFASTPRGRSLIRMVHAEGGDQEVAALACSIRERKESDSAEVLARAVARGELPQGTDPRLVFGTLIGAINHMLTFHGPPGERHIERLVDLVLTGAQAGGGLDLSARAPAPATSADKKRRSRAG